jgi:hypothetical protein
MVSTMIIAYSLKLTLSGPESTLDAEPEVDTRSPDQATPVVEAPKPNRKPQSTRGGRYYQRGGPKPAVTSPVVEGDAPVSPAGEKKCE